MRRFGTFIVIVVALFFVLKAVEPFIGMFQSARKEQTKKTLNVSESLGEAIRAFENTRQQVSNDIPQLTKQASKLMYTTNLKHDAKLWIQRWDNVRPRFSRLENDLKKVETKLDDFFGELHNISSGISDKELKKSELRKNSELKESWTLILKSAWKDISKLRSFIDRGNDIKRALLGATLREEIRTEFNQLDSISIRAKNFVDDLKEITDEGRKLVDMSL